MLLCVCFFYAIILCKLLHLSYPLFQCGGSMQVGETRHGSYQQEPTQHNTTSEICWLLCTQQPTFVQLVVVYPTTNIHNFISWCCVPNTSNCWVVLCTQLFSKKIQHEKRIISASRVFLLFKKQACYGSF